MAISQSPPPRQQRQPTSAQSRRLCHIETLFPQDLILTSVYGSDYFLPASVVTQQKHLPLSSSKSPMPSSTPKKKSEQYTKTMGFAAPLHKKGNRKLSQLALNE